MNLRSDQLAAHLAKAAKAGALAPLYLIHGDELLLQIEAADAIRAAALALGYGEREVWTIEQHFKWDEATATQDNFSLFASKKITEIRVPTGRLGVEGGERMRSIAQKATADDVIIATFPKLDRTQQGSAWFGAWGERAVVVEALPIEREQMAVWLGKRLGEQTQTADADALEFLVEHCEGNLIAAIQEVKKLALVCPQPALTRADIEDAVTNVARYTISQLSEAFLKGDVERFTVVLDGLRSEGESVVPIIWQLQDDVHALARALMHWRGGQVNASAAVRSARVWGKRAGTVEAALARISPRVIAPLIHDFAELDAASKGLRPLLNVWSELTRVAVKLEPRAP